MTRPLSVTPAKARQLQRDNKQQGVPVRRYTGREILPGVVVHVADDVAPETVQALEAMCTALVEQLEEQC